MHDLVIKNGTVVDGTGAPAAEADVAINVGKISDVGSDVGTDLGSATREIDAGGRVD